jgi:hypothetical protein
LHFALATPRRIVGLVTEFETPAIKAFVARLGQELAFAQVLIRRNSAGFELRHVRDSKTPVDKLRAVSCADARTLAQFTTDGVFRPLKSAPNLQSGWRIVVPDAAGLEVALNHLYPGALADWLATASGTPPVTHYREFTQRQSGMYRITTFLDDAQAGAMIRACCHESFCLKRRWWSVNGLEPDPADKKSMIPCLEPCALLLEFARTATRIEQEEKRPITATPAELGGMIPALESALSQPVPGLREADFSTDQNPRRIRLHLEKLKARLPAPSPIRDSD